MTFQKEQNPVRNDIIVKNDIPKKKQNPVRDDMIAENDIPKKRAESRKG